MSGIEDFVFCLFIPTFWASVIVQVRKKNTGIDHQYTGLSVIIGKQIIFSVSLWFLKPVYPSPHLEKGAMHYLYKFHGILIVLKAHYSCFSVVAFRYLPVFSCSHCRVTRLAGQAGSQWDAQALLVCLQDGSDTIFI